MERDVLEEAVTNPVTARLTKLAISHRNQACVPFVGREAELAVLGSCMQRVSEGEPQVALIAGEAGIGKTSLVRCFLKDAAPARVVRASGDERETAITYGIVAQLASLTPAHALREARAVRSGPLPGADPLVIGTELSSTWATLARSSTAIVVVEDLHWADTASAEAILSGVRRIRRGSVLIIVTCRPHELARLGGRWERFAASDERCTRISLSGFGDDSVRTLARAVRGVDVPRTVAQRIVDHTGGNPRYISALVEELPASAFAELGGSLPAPRSLSEVITSRLAALTAPAQRLVIAAAVLGRSCDLVTAARLADLTDPLEALEEGRAVHLLDEVAGAGGREVTFPHPLIRAAVYGTLGPARRRQLHQGAAELTVGPASLPHRVAAAIGPDDSLAGELDAAASEQENQCNLLTAAELWRQSSDLSAMEHRRDERLVRAANCLVRGGDAARAQGLRISVEQCCESSLQQLVLGVMAYSRSDAASGEEHLRRSSDLGAQNGDIPAACEAAGLRGELHLQMGRLGEAEHLLRSALAEYPRDAPQHISLLARIAIVAVAQGRVAEGRAFLADPAFPSSADTCARSQLDALFHRACAWVYAERLDDALADLTSIVRRGHEFIAPRYECVDSIVLLGHAQYRLGHWADAVANYEETIALASETEQSWISPYIHGLAAMPRALRGEWREAEAHVLAAHAAESGEFALGVFYSAAGAAILAWARGDAGELLEFLAEPARSQAVTQFSPCLFAFEPLRIDALLDLRRLDEAECLLQTIESSSEYQELPSLALDLRRLRGKLEMTRGCADAAAAAFGAGVERATAVGVPFAVALFHLEHGRFLRATRQTRAAVGELALAHALFAQMGARPFVDAVNRELRAPGMPTRTSPAGSPRQLTEKEVRVAHHVTAGLTNREIAKDLFVTTKAVEYRLARIYAKLGIASRTELAAQVTRDLYAH